MKKILLIGNLIPISARVQTAVGAGDADEGRALPSIEEVEPLQKAVHPTPRPVFDNLRISAEANFSVSDQKAGEPAELDQRSTRKQIANGAFGDLSIGIVVEGTRRSLSPSGEENV